MGGAWVRSGRSGWNTPIIKIQPNLHTCYIRTEIKTRDRKTKALGERPPAPRHPERTQGSARLRADTPACLRRATPTRDYNSWIVWMTHFAATLCTAKVVRKFTPLAERSLAPAGALLNCTEAVSEATGGGIEARLRKCLAVGWPISANRCGPLVTWVDFLLLFDVYKIMCVSV